MRWNLPGPDDVDPWQDPLRRKSQERWTSLVLSSLLGCQPSRMKDFFSFLFYNMRLVNRQYMLFMLPVCYNCCHRRAMAEGPAYHIQHTTSLEAAGFGNPQSQLILLQ